MDSRDDFQPVALIWTVTFPCSALVEILSSSIFFLTMEKSGKEMNRLRASAILCSLVLPADIFPELGQEKCFL